MPSRKFVEVPLEIAKLLKVPVKEVIRAIDEGCEHRDNVFLGRLLVFLESVLTDKEPPALGIHVSDSVDADEQLS